jgi:hypothetical protein
MLGLGLLGRYRLWGDVDGSYLTRGMAAGGNWRVALSRISPKRAFEFYTAPISSCEFP